MAELKDKPSFVKKRPVIKQYTDETIIPKIPKPSVPKEQAKKTKPHTHVNPALVLAVIAVALSLFSVYLSFTYAGAQHDVAQEILALKNKRIIVQMDTSQPIFMNGDVTLYFSKQTFEVPLEIPLQGIQVKAIDLKTGMPVTFEINETLQTNAFATTVSEYNANFTAQPDVKAVVIVNTTLDEFIGQELERIAQKLE